MKIRNALSRPALGQVADIGTLYDATTDSFVETVFRPVQIPQDVIREANDCRDLMVKTIATDHYNDKLSLLGASADLGASILGRLTEDGTDPISPNSPIHFLRRHRTTNGVAPAALVYRRVTSRDTLNLRSHNLAPVVDQHVLQNTRATHVVTAIEWGAETVIEINEMVSMGQDSMVAAAVETLRALVNDVNEVNDEATMIKPGTGNLSIIVSSNVIQQPVPMESVKDVQQYLFKDVRTALWEHNDDKGCPVMYTLIPISRFMDFIGVDDSDDYGPTTITHISPEHLEYFHDLFDRVFARYRQAMDYAAFLKENGPYVFPDYSLAIQELVQHLDDLVSEAQLTYGHVIHNVRRGSTPLTTLQDLRKDIMGLMEAYTFEEYRDKIKFIAHSVESGATYLGHDNTTDLSGTLEQQGPEAPSVYVLSLSQAAMQHVTWPATKALLMELLQPQHGTPSVVFIEDCDMTGQQLQTPCITEYKEGIEVTKDVLTNRQYLADKNFARYKEASLETDNVQKPVRRRFVKIPCPGLWCNGATDQSWMCPKCFHLLEYGHSDDYIYCDCGRSHFSNYAFKCNNTSSHGPNYVPFSDDRKLRSHLQSLDSSDYLNILILGETGVGKSTFINAFVNYLAFDTLDDALNSEDLQWVVPCSFDTQVMDRSQPSGKIIQHKVQVGDRMDEHDGSKGMSATQQTSVYPINFGSKTVRLIDTPGIGDTRGVQFDKKNMADILATLNSYEKLHGILILLKSNNARLTITFRFCVQELLTHLHRSAVNNIAFAFTNTRMSNFTPGDTFGPLQTLLEQHSDIDLPLNMETAYCFDSEGFRYLAANKQGVIMENEEDFRRSWKHSSDESRRLVGYFESKPPHSVKNTISLNGTRQLILELVKPLAEISQLIRLNIAMCEDLEQALADSRLSGAELRKKMFFRRVELHKKNIVRPRTVCTHRDCISERDDGKGKRVVEYKTLCHAPCGLNGVTQEVIAFPGLIKCYAFQLGNKCRVCSHHWRQHMHILYEFEQVVVNAIDPGIEKALAASTADSELRRMAVQEAQQLISEYKLEHERVQAAAVEFGLYLKKHSITAYNDVTLDYLDMLINHEKEKIAVGGSRERLDGLELDRQQHLELVAVLTASIEEPAGPDTKAYTILGEADVEARVRELYGLKHFGANLQAVQQTISDAHAATYRERPYRVADKKHGKPQGGKRDRLHERVQVRIPRTAGDGMKKVISSFFNFLRIKGGPKSQGSADGVHSVIDGHGTSSQYARSEVKTYAAVLSVDKNGSHSGAQSSSVSRKCSERSLDFSE